MEYLIGLLIGVVFFIWSFFVLYIGYRVGNKHRKPTRQVDEEQQRKAEKIKKSFMELMSYDVNKALQRKKVNE